MKKIVNSFTITTILLLTITSCSTECDEPTKVPLKQLSDYVSYTGYDTLRFLHNNTDTQIFIGQGVSYFWVRKPAFDDTQCPEDHESLAIQFKNHQNGDVIKMEYVYDYNDFPNGYPNSHTFYRFEYNSLKIDLYDQVKYYPKLLLNGINYSNIMLFNNRLDQLVQVGLATPNNSLFGGIVFIKNQMDSLTLVR